MPACALSNSLAALTNAHNSLSISPLALRFPQNPPRSKQSHRDALSTQTAHIGNHGRPRNPLRLGSALGISSANQPQACSDLRAQTSTSSLPYNIKFAAVWSEEYVLIWHKWEENQRQTIGPSCPLPILVRGLRQLLCCHGDTSIGP